MALSPRDRLGPYEVLAPIGAGGMGEVWKARDTRLDRTVAVKTSKVEFNERFEREARAVAALNHPHICQLYDVGPNFLVMEFVEGTPLKGPMPLDRALALAIQLADALDAAHRKGITHRDLKPANVLLTKSGVKVLDFGIAKIERTRGVATAAEETVTQSPTRDGTILGTLQYMAPEQLQAKDVDGRADIFSFGCVLYEMLTGKRAFDGTNAASIIAAVMERPAPSLCEVAPAALDRVVKKCLAKDPDQRWQAARDLKDELVWIAGGGPEVPPRAEAHPAGSRLLWALVAGGLMVIAASAAWIMKPAPARPVVRTVIDLGPDEHFANLDSPAVAISPDGANVVYAASRGSSRSSQLFLRRFDTLKAEPIAGSEDATSPFFSPDGQWIAFFAGGKLKKTPVAGGSTITLCEAGTSSGGTWGPNHTILFQRLSGPFLEIPESGGNPRRLEAATKHGVWRWPQLMPDGRTVVFVRGTNAFLGSGASIAAAGVDGAGAEKDLIAGGTAPRLAATGDLIYARNGTLAAVPFNATRVELAGSPVPALEGVRQSIFGAAQYSLSAQGTLVYISGGFEGSSSHMIWVDRAGKEQPLKAPGRVYYFPRLSPDGRRVAVLVSETTTDLSLYDITRDSLSRVTLGGTGNTSSVWSPDGTRLVFGFNRPEGMNLAWQLADGSGAAQRLTTSPFLHVGSSWSPDGQTVAFFESNPETGLDIWIVGLGDLKARPFLKTQANEAAPKFSPDGHWLVYQSDESGRWEIYVQAYPGPGGKWQVSNGGGTEPLWNPTGHELFYRAGNRMMAVPVVLQPVFSMGKPVVLFEGPWLLSNLTQPNYDVSRDGQRFLMLKAADEDRGPRQIVVVQNWFEELKRRMAAGKK